MSDGWTKGPWKVGPENIVRKEDTDDQGRRRTQWIAEALLTRGGTMTEDQAKANARLISAAPDMAEALERMISRCEGLIFEVERLEEGGEPFRIQSGIALKADNEAIAKAAAALAKARGQS